MRIIEQFNRQQGAFVEPIALSFNQLYPKNEKGKRYIVPDDTVLSYLDLWSDEFR